MEQYIARLMFSCEVHEEVVVAPNDDVLLRFIDPEDGATKYLIDKERLSCSGEGEHLFFVTLQTNPDETFSSVIEVLRNEQADEDNN